MWRKNSKEPWKGKYHTGGLCTPCQVAFWFDFEILMTYVSGKKQVEHIVMKSCDSCRNYILKERNLVDWEPV